MTDTLPSGVSFAGNLTASSGTADESGGVSHLARGGHRGQPGHGPI